VKALSAYRAATKGSGFLIDLLTGVLKWKLRLVSVNIGSQMATEHILSLLVAERDKLNKAIAALGGTTAPASRPSKSSESPTPAAPAKRKKKRKPLTAAQKKHQSERMKAFWAAKRKKQAKA
jgi:hypothetical protein